MLKFLSSVSCTSKIHSFFIWELLGNFTCNWELNDSRVTSVECTWLGLE